MTALRPPERRLALPSRRDAARAEGGLFGLTPTGSSSPSLAAVAPSAEAEGAFSGQYAGRAAAACGCATDRALDRRRTSAIIIWHRPGCAALLSGSQAGR